MSLASPLVVDMVWMKPQEPAMGSSAGIRICVSSQALYTARDAKTESINMNPELSRGPDGGNVSTQYRGSGACLET